MGPDELRAEIRRLGPWHHDLEFAPGVRTGEPVAAGTYPADVGTPSMIDPAHGLGWLEQVYPGGAEGRSMLDCACNAGGYLFAGRQAGIGRGFGFDAREHWIRQARFAAQHLPSDDLEFATCTVQELPGHTAERFDITLFKGILYHLPDPVASLRAIADRTDELLVVNTATKPARRPALVLVNESREQVMSGVDGLAWLPTGDPVVRQMLGWCGFPHTRLRWSRRTGNGLGRIELLAARDAATLAHVPDQVARDARWRRIRRPPWLARATARGR